MLTGAGLLLLDTLELGSQGLHEAKVTREWRQGIKVSEDPICLKATMYA